jgi:hypothetical protein
METEYIPSLLCNTLVASGEALSLHRGAGSSYSIASPMSVADELPVILTFTKSPIW